MVLSSKWGKLPLNQREEYVAAVQGLASLTPLFKQKSSATGTMSPYIVSKFQENAFAHFFGGNVVDVDNQPYDISLQDPASGSIDLIGIKTFLHKSSSSQKIMQFKNLAVEEGWRGYQDQGATKQIIQMISKTRNRRMASHEATIAGVGNDPEAVFGERYYHYLCPADDGTIFVGETAYSQIDLSRLQLLVNGKKSVVFTDSRKVYKYTFADSTLHMNFDHRGSGKSAGSDIVDKFAATYLTDPYRALALMAKPSILNGSGLEQIATLPVSEPTTSSDTESHVWTIYSPRKYRDTPAGEVHAKSGLNHWHAGPKNPNHPESGRPIDEAYIPIPRSVKFHQEFPNFFGVDEYGTPISKMVKNNKGTWESVFPGRKNKERRSFELILKPSNTSIRAYLTESSNKAIMSLGKQTELGRWLLRDVMQLEVGEILTRSKLIEINIDAFKLTKLGNRRVSLEFVQANEGYAELLWNKKGVELDSLEGE